eukprot:1181229-Lingulodinium_polyedra.AAC.1
MNRRPSTPTRFATFCIGCFCVHQYIMAAVWSRGSVHFPGSVVSHPLADGDCRIDPRPRRHHPASEAGVEPAHTAVQE